MPIKIFKNRQDSGSWERINRVKMADEKNQSDDDLRLGFLTVLGTIPTGLIGGLLVLNRLGQPLEFHCTAPVRPNRAQEILYGTALEPYLYGQQIAAALLRKTKGRCFAVITDSFPVLAAQDLYAYPLIMLFPPDSPDGSGFSAAASNRIGGFRLSDWQELPPAKDRPNRLAVAHRFWDDSAVRTRTESGLACFLEAVDLTEPFERIALAVQESQRS